MKATSAKTLRRRRRLLAEGRCIWCGAAAEDPLGTGVARTFCAGHRAARNAYQRAWVAKRRTPPRTAESP